MRRFSCICVAVLGLPAFFPSLVSGAGKQRPAALVADTVFVIETAPLPLSADTPTDAFIRTGDMVAERDIAFFTADLLDTYRILENDERNLSRLFMRCDRSWGATAYALALQAASRVPMRAVLMEYDAAGRDWERTAVRMGLVYTGSCEPSYAFGVYLNRQRSVWRKMLEGPLRWRRMFLSR